MEQRTAVLPLKERNSEFPQIEQRGSSFISFSPSSVGKRSLRHNRCELLRTMKQHLPKLKEWSFSERPPMHSRLPMREFARHPACPMKRSNAGQVLHRQWTIRLRTELPAQCTGGQTTVWTRRPSNTGGHTRPVALRGLHRAADYTGQLSALHRNPKNSSSPCSYVRLRSRLIWVTTIDDQITELSKTDRLA